MDGKEMYRVVRESKTLDVNSEYSYLLWSKYFKETSIIALDGDQVIGFITGFIPPEQKNTLFIWQVAVDESYRGYGLGTRLIKQLFQRVNESKPIEYIDATVTPSNEPSINLFKGIANKFHTSCEITEGFTKEQFTDIDHEEERLFRIGPIFKQ